MIWHFDNTDIYVLGSVHLLREHDNNHLDIINEVYSNATNIVFETSLDFDEFEENGLFYYIDDKLSKNISKSLLRDVKKSWQRCGLKYALLEKSKIWHATLSLSSSIFGEKGFLHENGIDSLIWEKSQNDNKTIEFLETQTDGLSCFDRAPIDEQRSDLAKVVRNKKESIYHLTEIIEAWKTCDEERLLYAQQLFFDESPILFRSLIIERNALWLSKFLSVLDSGIPTLFVVGAFHCVGTSSIQHELRENHGYTSKIINVKP